MKLCLFFFLCALCVTHASKKIVELTNGANGCTYFQPCVKNFDGPKKVQVKCTSSHIMVKTWNNEEDVRVECSEIAEVTPYINVKNELTAVSPNSGSVYIYILDE